MDGSDVRTNETATSCDPVSTFAASNTKHITMRTAQANKPELHPELAIQLIEFLQHQLNPSASHLNAEALTHILSQAACPGQEIPKVDHADMVLRITRMHLHADDLIRFITRYAGLTRLYCISQGWLSADAPAQGSTALLPADRSITGNRLLTEAKDMLFALLFGDVNLNVTFDRSHRETLTLTIPSHKLGALDYMQASSQYEVLGTWRDPQGHAHDVRARNTVMEIEYGETDDELIGDGILTCLRIINLLEVNEQVLYARMQNVEQSSLVEGEI